MTAHRHKNAAGKYVTVSDGDHGHAAYSDRIKALEARVTLAEQRLAVYDGGGVTPPPPPAPPPTGTLAFTNIKVTEVDADSARISWNVTPPATGQVEYGKTAAYGKTSALETTPLAFHSQVIAGLDPATTYHFRIQGVA